jgi:alcohol dehydrogenase
MELMSIRQMQTPAPMAPFALTQVPPSEPGIDQVRVTVEACGVCHSDTLVVAGHWPGLTFPLTTGHEIAGRIDALGAGVSGWEIGDRAAIGWYGGSCGHCDACRSGDGVWCAQTQVPGISYSGGFADSVVVPAVALAAIPDQLAATDAAPLACAGVTAYNGLRRSSARAGDLVAVIGLGGIGHLAVQFAAKMGFETVAISRGPDKADVAKQLGAAHYIDGGTQNVADALRALGGAKVVLASTTDAKAMGAAVDGLARRGELVVVGVSTDSLELSAYQVFHQGHRVYGHASGVAVDTQDTLRFAAQSGVRPWTEVLPLEQADLALSKLAGGQVRFRMVLTTGN